MTTISPTQSHPTPATLIDAGEATLGIELGSTRIKACLIDPSGAVLASGAHEWENVLVDGHWSYSLDAVWSGVAEAYAQLSRNVSTTYSVTLTRIRALGVSAMMHGYLAFDAEGTLLTPFRTWRDTYTGAASDELTRTFGVNIPLRWSISHYYQAILDGEEHVSNVQFLTTLAGYVHWKLTGRKVLGVGDAVGMFPIDATTGTYHNRMITQFDELAAARGVGTGLRSILPQVLRAGDDAGTLTDDGARLIDPTGTLRAGCVMCPPEGDAGTGMVATNAVRPRTGNVSVGTSIFAMIVLERDLRELHTEIDPVTTPAGDPVAMVHCNNGAAEIATWVSLMCDAAARMGAHVSKDEAYRALLTAALDAAPDADGITVYNYLSGEPVAGLVDGRPMVWREPTATLNVANLMRAHIFGAYAALALGMRILNDEGVSVDVVFGHGGIFRTPEVAQRLLAAALNTPVGIADSASEGGAWGIAVLAHFTASRHAALEDRNDEEDISLADFLDREIFSTSTPSIITPAHEDVAGFSRFLERYHTGLVAQHAITDM